MPMLWRYATVAAAARLDSARRYGLGRPGRTPAARGAVRRFLGWYGPSTPAAFGEWAGLARPHARRLWDEVADDLAEVEVGRTRGWLLRDDLAALGSPPAAEGVRLLPPGDPFLQPANRALLVPDAEHPARPCSAPSRAPARSSAAGGWWGCGGCGCRAGAPTWRSSGSAASRRARSPPRRGASPGSGARRGRTSTCRERRPRPGARHRRAR